MEEQSTEQLEERTGPKRFVCPICKVGQFKDSPKICSRCKDNLLNQDAETIKKGFVSYRQFRDEMEALRKRSQSTYKGILAEFKTAFPEMVSPKDRQWALNMIKSREFNNQDLKMVRDNFKPEYGIQFGPRAYPDKFGYERNTR